MSAPFTPIHDHGVIGDLHSAALVSELGAIDFWCYPRFDSPSVFAHLLDSERGGLFSVETSLDNVRAQQLYLPGTNILLTRLLSDSGILEITDFMPFDGHHADRAIVRIFDAVRGDIHLRLRCAPRPGYAARAPRVEKIDDHWLLADGEQELLLRAECGLESDGTDVIGTARLREGQRLRVALGPRSLAEIDDLESWVRQRFDITSDYWRAWSAKSRYHGRWREVVSRSALTLKLLTSHEHGSIVAAPTFGLPEQVGGCRNWDYRYTWIRDAAFTIFALDQLGYTDETSAFLAWLERVAEPGADLEVVYRIDGSRCMDEVNLETLAGYRDSSPVRIGNDAHKQFQLDIYGELFESIYESSRRGRMVAYDTWLDLRTTADYVCETWDSPDHGIWEVRGEKRFFFHSRLMCWVALDRAMRLAEERGLPHPRETWRRERDAIYESLFEEFWNEDAGSFVQHKDTDALDASALMMPLVGAIAGSDPRWQRTLDAIQKRLVHGALLYRYHQGEDSVDPIKGPEGCFTTCSFWFVEALARGDRVSEARILFEKLLAYSNDLGLYAEEISGRGSHLGNFPQALTHLALISAALALDEALNEREMP